MMAFLPTRQVLRELLGWAPAPRSVLRMVDSVGAQARAFLGAGSRARGRHGRSAHHRRWQGGTDHLQRGERETPAAPPKEHGGIRQRKKSGSPKKRRGPGKKSKNAKMAAVGVICTLKRGRPSGMIAPRQQADVRDVQELPRRCSSGSRRRPIRRGYGTNKFKKVQFVADGAETLWDLQQEFFPDAEVCLDWMHAVEKLWACGKAINRGSRTKREPLEAMGSRAETLLRMAS